MKLLTLFIMALLLTGTAKTQFFSSAGDQEGDQGSGGNEQATYSILVGASWNLVSVPIVQQDFAVPSVFPGALSSQATGYQGGVYTTHDSLRNGAGYWLKFASPDVVYLEGSSIEADSIPLAQGWNLIGSITSPVAAGSIVVVGTTLRSPFYGFSSIGYSAASTIEPGSGYWVKSAGAGTLVLEEIPALLKQRKTPVEGTILATLNMITVRSANGAEQRLYCGRIPGEEFDINFFELPPSPPEGIMDVRFASQRMAEFYPRNIEGSAVFPIVLRGMEYPVTVHRTIAEGTTERIRITDMAGEDVARQGTDGSFVVTDPRMTTLMLNITEGVELPAVFALHQNYPNPFNPSTTLRFDLPGDARVTIAIYNVLGQRVRSIVDDYLEAGVHTMSFDASSLASGVYFYRMDARSTDGSQRFGDVRKLVLLK